MCFGAPKVQAYKAPDPAPVPPPPDEVKAMAPAEKAGEKKKRTDLKSLKIDKTAITGPTLSSLTIPT